MRKTSMKPKAPRPSVKSSKKLKKVIRSEINKQIAADRKYFDTVPNATYAVAYDAPVSYPLCLVGQGDSQSDRDGRELGLLRIDLYIAAFRNSSNTTGSHDRMTIALVKMSADCAGVAPVWGDVFEYSGTAHSSVIPLRNMGNGDAADYQVLKVWQLDLGDSTGNPKSTRSITYRKTYKVPQKVCYDATSAAIGSCTTGHYFLLATSDVVASGYPPYIQYASRIYYNP